MTQGELEKLPLPLQREWSRLENRIMSDVVRRIKINGFSTASASWQISRLQQLGQSDAQIKKWLGQALKASKSEVERILSDTAYEQYMEHGRGYRLMGIDQVPFEENVPLQQMITAMSEQCMNEFNNMSRSAAFAVHNPDGTISNIPIGEFYNQTVDGAIMDMQSGAFTYQQTLKRIVNTMTASGLRTILYESGRSERVDVAARRAMLTGWRQVNGLMSEQTASELGTDSYEVTVHVGARPSHQEWEGKVYTKAQLIEVCGLGSVTGLHGANCYHDYYPFIPGVSTRTYTDEQLQQIHDRENTPKTYNGREYTTYEALQKQRQLERRMRKYNEDIHLLELGDGDPDDILASKIKYKTTMAQYKDFSKQMELPMQKERITQNGLKVPDLRGVEEDRTKVFGAIKGQNGYYDPDAVFNVNIPYLSQETNDLINRLCKESIDIGNETGYEHGYTIDINTLKVKHYTSNMAGAVFDRDFFDDIKGKPNGSVITIHNHANNIGFSYDDMNTFATNPQLLINIAACHDGTAYVLHECIKKLKTGIAQFESDEPEYSDIVDELNLLRKNGKLMTNDYTKEKEKRVCERIAKLYFKKFEVVENGNEK